MIDDGFDIWLEERYGQGYLFDKYEFDPKAYRRWLDELRDAFQAGCDFMEGRDPVAGF